VAVAQEPPLADMYIVLYHSHMAKQVNISAARRELPSLFDRVTRRDGEKVIIRRRDAGPEAVLVSRDYIDSLEQATRDLARATPFRLVGSGELLGSVEDVIATMRGQQTRERDARLDELAPRRKR
jgi:PHD/YefM family antitoxin component YafN of YafNO toxin-antitoxin module